MSKQEFIEKYGYSSRLKKDYRGILEKVDNREECLADLNSIIEEEIQKQTPTRAEIRHRLSVIYHGSDKVDARYWVAKICDEVLDRTGRLLGEVREFRNHVNGGK